MSIDDCAITCNNLIGFECESFDYCYLSGECRLTNMSAPSIDDDVILFDDEFCDIYTSILNFLIFKN